MRAERAAPKFAAVVPCVRVCTRTHDGGDDPVRERTKTAPALLPAPGAPTNKREFPSESAMEAPNREPAYPPGVGTLPEATSHGPAAPVADVYV